jgi:hypothetical protein
MFNSAVVNASSFLKMPLTSQALYFHLGLQADDDGIVDAFATTRMVGSSEDDLKILASKGYIVPLNDDMLLWIVHFNLNNTLRADRVKPSIHREILLDKVPNAFLIEPKQDNLYNERGMPPDIRRKLGSIF